MLFFHLVICAGLCGSIHMFQTVSILKFPRWFLIYMIFDLMNCKWNSPVRFAASLTAGQDLSLLWKGHLTQFFELNPGICCRSPGSCRSQFTVHLKSSLNSLAFFGDWVCCQVMAHYRRLVLMVPICVNYVNCVNCVNCVNWKNCSVSQSSLHPVNLLAEFEHVTILWGLELCARTYLCRWGFSWTIRRLVSAWFEWVCDGLWSVMFSLQCPGWCSMLCLDWNWNFVLIYLFLQLDKCNTYTQSVRVSYLELWLNTGQLWQCFQSLIVSSKSKSHVDQVLLCFWTRLANGLSAEVDLMRCSLDRLTNWFAMCACAVTRSNLGRFQSICQLRQLPQFNSLTCYGASLAANRENSHEIAQDLPKALPAACAEIPSWIVVEISGGLRTLLHQSLVDLFVESTYLSVDRVNEWTNDEWRQISLRTGSRPEDWQWA